MERANVIIVGGGVVGCALAAELAARYPDVFLLEALPKLGMLTSSRNSGVIHSGLYYPKDSLKARHCVEGNRLLYEFCSAHGVKHIKTGKVIVANPAEEEAQLDALLARGRENGVEGLERLSSKALGRHEPHISAKSALWVPPTGIVESEGLVKALAALAAQNGAYIATSAPLEAVEPHPGFLRLRAGMAGEIETRVLINSAGLFADEVAGLCGTPSYQIHPCRGEYWEITPDKAGLINGPVYPAPDPTGLYLGVHLTKTVWGTLLAGPNARYVDRKDDYESDWEPRDSFCQRVQKLLPQIQPEDLHRAYSGIRPKLTAPGEPGMKDFKDFIVERDSAHPNIIHLAGIESPGLTAALSLARHVAELASETLD